MKKGTNRLFSWGRIIQGLMLCAVYASLVVHDAFSKQVTASKALEELSSNYSRQKVAVIEHHDGFLRLGDAKAFDVPLEQGRTYYFVAGGCEDAFDVDLIVRDQNGSLSHDVDQGHRARIDFTAPETKTYTVLVKMARSAQDGAHFSFIVARTSIELDGMSRVGTDASQTKRDNVAPASASGGENPSPEPQAERRTVPPQTSAKSGKAKENEKVESKPNASNSASRETVNLDQVIQDEGGNDVTLRSLMGDSKALYIRVWASWCVYCRQLGPTLDYRANVLRKGNVGLIALNVYENRSNFGLGDLREIRGDRKKHRIPNGIPLFVQTQPKEFTGRLKIDSIPRTVLIDRTGAVLFKGNPRDPSLSEVLRELGIATFDVNAGL